VVGDSDGRNFAPAAEQRQVAGTVEATDAAGALIPVKPIGRGWRGLVANGLPDPHEPDRRGPAVSGAGGTGSLPCRLALNSTIRDRCLRTGLCTEVRRHA